ncbi:MAG: peptidoglycan DD-metalloendopeptidase family protein [Firmicutes bacterium]|nr:peptidoglycan DD-metalloendopeptidase family protein [Bacillota bacterium]
MGKGGKALCIVLALLLAAFGFYAAYERSRADGLEQALLDANGINDKISEQKMDLQLRNEQLEARVQALSEELEQKTSELANLYIAPRVTFSRSEAIQGDIVVVHVEMNSEEGEPSIKTELGAPVFFEDPSAGGTPAIGTSSARYSKAYTAYVPVGFAQTPGDYIIDVGINGHSYAGAVKVSERKYGEQHMTMSSATASSTIGASNANEDYAQKVKSTFFTAEPKKYWEGQFIQPVEGRVTTEFGLYRYTEYTDGTSRKMVRHTGVDIASPEGTPVPASNAGKVVFAGDVIITGGTIVIDHGGGLKSYYFHLSSVDCRTGDVVGKGDVIGKVGSTGYATGPHLHFELKIGEYSLSPWELWDGTSDIYK